MDRIIMMIVNRLMGQLINRGINAGINHVANKGRKPEDMTPEERGQAQETKAAAKRARQAANLARRMMR